MPRKHLYASSHDRAILASISPQGRVLAHGFLARSQNSAMPRIMQAFWEADAWSGAHAALFDERASQPEGLAGVGGSRISSSGPLNPFRPLQKHRDDAFCALARRRTRPHEPERNYERRLTLSTHASASRRFVQLPETIRGDLVAFIDSCSSERTPSPPASQPGTPPSDAGQEPVEPPLGWALCVVDEWQQQPSHAAPLRGNPISSESPRARDLYCEGVRQLHMVRITRTPRECAAV